MLNSFGVVYKNNKKRMRTDYLSSLINIMIEGQHMLIKYCLDKEGNKWEEIKDSTLNNIDLLFNHYYGQVYFTSHVFGKQVNVSITIYKEINYFGFLVDVYDFNLEEQLDCIIQFICGKVELLQFDYAFIDEDGEIEVDPLEVEFGDVEFPVLFKRLNGGKEIKLEYDL